MRFLFAVLCLAGSVSGQTNVGNASISGTVRYTKAMSPITFGLVNVWNGTLIIDPGVEMIASEPSSSICLRNGAGSALSIQGTDLDPVIMRPAGTAWRGIYNISRSTKPIIEISGAYLLGTGSSTNTIDAVNANVQLLNSVLQGARATRTGAPTQGVRFGGTIGCIGFVDGCLIDGFTTGVNASRGVVITNTDIRNTVTPITIPQSANVTVSISVE
jgi:hypothetical protein